MKLRRKSMVTPGPRVARAIRGMVALALACGGFVGGAFGDDLACGDLAWLPEASPVRDTQPGALLARDFLTEEEGADLLAAAVRHFEDQPEWEAAFAAARRRIREGAGLWPWPERTSLNPIFRAIRSYDGYSVLNVAFEAVPGYWVGGNLYLPDNLSDPVPAILHTHGHSAKVTDPGGWERHGRFKDDVQYRAATLARMGAVSLTIDMFGYGDSTVALGPDAHRHGDAMTIQIWSAIRAVDFLESLPYVDPKRIAVTGHSGGGTQAFLLAALDHRISASIPVAMVSAHFFGGCPCESGKPIHRGRDHFVSNPMIAALAAPRPQLLVSVGGDWTHATPGVEYPFLKEVYSDFGVPENVENVHLAEEGHNYGRSKRLALYAFLSKHLGIGSRDPREWDGGISEAAVTIESPAQMRVFPGAMALPEGALRDGDAVMAALQRLKDPVGPLEIAQMCCADMIAPVGLDPEAVTFGWKLRSEGTNKRQRAWQIQVSVRRDGFDDREDLLWDSAKVIDSRQGGRPYGGRPLRPSEIVWWRVRVWDEADSVGPWSEPARVITGLSPSNWDALWMSHPDWLSFNRERLGYRSLPASTTNSPKWIEVDLGKVVAVDEVILRAVRHTVAERLGFPTRFRLLLSSEPEFRSPVVIADFTDAPLNPWRTRHRVVADGVRARFVRLEVPVLRELNGEICLALSQIEVRSDGENIAVGAKVEASDSLENDQWATAALVDGQDAPESNPIANATVVFERVLHLDEVPSSAVAHLAGLGTYVARINGERVGSRRLSPGWTDSTARVLYDSYEVSSLLRPGDNLIELHVAGGMYSVPPADGRYTKFVGPFRPLQAIFQLHGDDPNAAPLLVSDASWRTRRGPVTYSHIFGGEDIDMRAEHDVEAVAAAIVAGPEGRLAGAERAADPVRVMQVLVADPLPSVPGQPKIYDLGQNAAVMVRLVADGPVGARIRVTPAELVDEDGRIDRVSSGGGLAFWQMTLNGEGPVRWESEFFYHGARYLQVETLPGPGTDELPVLLRMEGLVIHANAPAAGTFRSSSEHYNRTHDLIRWAQRSNLMSVLTDCPHRERLGWLEQYHLNGPALRYSFDLKRHYRKTLADMQGSQTAGGLVPNIAPEYIVFEGAFRDSPEWGSAIVLAAWQQYLFHGDTETLRENWSAMCRYFDYLREQSVDGLPVHGLGDWYDLGPHRPGFAQLTLSPVTAGAIYYEVADTLSRVARVLGMDADARSFEAEAGRIRDLYDSRFLDADTGAYGPATQTALAMAIATGLSGQDQPCRTASFLVGLLEREEYRLTAGDVGHRYLLTALSTIGRDDLVDRLHGASDRPGYGFQLRSGATSLTESWDANRRASQNHFMLGHAMEWFYGGLGGIRPDPLRPGFERVIVDPRPVDSVDWVSARYDSDRGTIAVRWRRTSDAELSLEVDVPPNAEARIQHPSRETFTEVGSGHWTFTWKETQP